MAKKIQTVFYCGNCGYESSKWMGQCPGCREWNTFVEEKVSSASSGKGRTSRPEGENKVRKLSEVSLEPEDRITTHIGELDRVLGGGLVAGSLTLVGGDPGIGKSTLLLQVMRNLSADGRKVLYVSGEESLKQIRLRAERIGTFNDNMLLFCETSLEAIEEEIRRQKPEAVVIDSIQTVYHDDISSAPGSVSQVREATAVLLRLAKGLGVTIFIVGHVTKEGTVAGPRVLEHMVDTVFYFEGDDHASYRILRGVKNRFGSTNEIGVFRMESEGLMEVPNPSEYMLSGKVKGAPGSVVVCSLEGSRPMLSEVQALVCHSSFGIPRRQTIGTDFNRVNLLMAVLEKRLGMQMNQMDAYVNLAGGIKITEPAIDLGIALAIMSSFKNKAVSDKLVAVGEIGLSGELRAVSNTRLRVQEAKKLGFDTVLLPKTMTDDADRIEGIRLIKIGNVSELSGLDLWI